MPAARNLILLCFFFALCCPEASVCQRVDGRGRECEGGDVRLLCMCVRLECGGGVWTGGLLPCPALSCPVLGWAVLSCPAVGSDGTEAVQKGNARHGGRHRIVIRATAHRRVVSLLQPQADGRPSAEKTCSCVYSLPRHCMPVCIVRQLPLSVNRLRALPAAAAAVPVS